MSARPRSTTANTRVDGILRRSFWAEYVRARLLGGNDSPIGAANAVFKQELIDRLKQYAGAEALGVPVMFTERLSNRLLAACIGLRDGSRIIAVNARFTVDPEVLAHTIIEEYIHAQQMADGVDFANQRQQFEYAERPYEIEAKSMADLTLGFAPGDFATFLVRDEPDGPLYDGEAP